MHRFFSLACAVAAATSLVVACGSSDDSSSGSNGGSSGSAGSSSNVQCVGDYKDLKQTEFSAKVSSSGKCGGSSDVGSICVNDVTTAAEQCGAGCVKMGGSTATQDACTATCLNGAVTPSLSDDCTGCYVADVGCARDNCLIQCGVAPASQACADCRQTNGCIDAFYTCSGLPVPGSSSTGGDTSTGAGGEPSANGGAGG